MPIANAPLILDRITNLGAWNEKSVLCFQVVKMPSNFTYAALRKKRGLRASF